MHHFFLLGSLIALLAAVFVASDANKRGMNGVLWGIGVFLLCIVFLPLYFIVRRPMIMTAPPPGYYPPPAGGPNPGARMCPACGKYYPGTAQFCPHCGAPQPH
jgi:hypothetical protein